jgi:hypothetical protein
MTQVSVDLVIVDYDAAGLRLIEYLNKRPIAEETRKLPLVPVIVLFPEPYEMGWKKSVEDVGTFNRGEA